MGRESRQEVWEAAAAVSASCTVKDAAIRRPKQRVGRKRWHVGREEERDEMAGQDIVVTVLVLSEVAAGGEDPMAERK